MTSDSEIWILETTLLVPTRNQIAKTIANALVKDCFVHFGITARLHSDQGANFKVTLSQNYMYVDFGCRQKQSFNLSRSLEWNDQAL